MCHVLYDMTPVCADNIHVLSVLATLLILVEIILKVMPGLQHSYHVLLSLTMISSAMVICVTSLGSQVTSTLEYPHHHQYHYQLVYIMTVSVCICVVFGVVLAVQMKL